MIEIDGAYGEGGGQIVRSSLTLSALTRKPVHIHSIRANRSQAGLRPQHLAAARAVAEITRGDLQGAESNATAISLKPEGLYAGRYQFDIPTAGASTLVMQTVVLPLSFASGSSQVSFSGGTHVKWSPAYHYLQQHWLPIMNSLGYRISAELEKAGFYPGGGGEIQSRFLPAKALSPIQCTERGELVSIRGLSGVANLTEDIARRQKHQALKRLYPICQDAKIKTLRLDSPGKGTFILLKAEFSTCGRACYTALGEPGKPAEKVADEAVDQLLAFLKTDGCFDQYLADQILLPLSLIEGESAFRTNAITSHLVTNAHLIEKFLPVRIKIEGEIDAPGLVQINGIQFDDLLQ